MVRDFWQMVPWHQQTPKDIIDVANRHLADEGYLVLNRVLALAKLLSYGQSSPLMWDIGVHLVAPFFFPELRRSHSEQWVKFDKVYQFCRRVAYLTMDGALANVAARVDMSALYRRLVSDKTDADIDEMLELAAELLSAYERMIFAHLYHSEEARSLVTIISDAVYKKLCQDPSPKDLLKRWLQASRLNDVIDWEQDVVSPPYYRCKTLQVSIRSYFLAKRGWITKDADLLRQEIGGQAIASVLRYDPWQHPVRLEPPEYLISVLCDGNFVGTGVRLLYWLSREIDTFQADWKNQFHVLIKQDIAGVYVSILTQIIQQCVADIHVEVRPWPVESLGKVKELSLVRGLAVVRDEGLASDFARYVVETSDLEVTGETRSLHHELGALGALRSCLHDQLRDRTELYFLLPSSIRLSRASTRDVVAEFDGGIVCADPYNGRLVGYLLEAKRRSTTKARNALRRKLQRLGMRSDSYYICALGQAKAAYAVVNFGLCLSPGLSETGIEALPRREVNGEAALADRTEQVDVAREKD